MFVSFKYAQKFPFDVLGDRPLCMHACMCVLCLCCIILATVLVWLRPIHFQYKSIDHVVCVLIACLMLV